jgi:ABC-2 type transport system permease protein
MVVAIVTLSSVFFSLAGFANAVYANNYDDVQFVPTFVLTPLIYLGGVFYSTDLLPEFWAGVSKLNPMLYIVNAFRYGFLGISDINVTFAFCMVLAFTIAAYFYCMHLLNTGKRLRQ